MLFTITHLSLLFPSFITLAFDSLAGWSLEWDVETGSSLRVGGKGLLLKTCIPGTFYDNARLFRVLLHVSVFLTAAGLLDWLFYAETVVTHSCVKYQNRLAQQSQLNSKRQERVLFHNNYELHKHLYQDVVVLNSFLVVFSILTILM